MKFSALAKKSLRSINAAPRAGEVSPEDTAIAFEAANDMLDAWAAKRLTIFHTQRKVYALTANKGTPTNPYTIGPGGNFDQARPLWIPTAMCLVPGDDPYEFELDVVNQDTYARISLKAIGSALPSKLFYDARFPSSGATVGLGQIFLYPVPDGSQSLSLVLYTPLALTAFADIDTTDYTFPPGYAEAMRYQLAIRLAIELGYPLTPDLSEMAATTFGVIQRPNARVPLLRCDSAMSGTGAAGSSYNWRTGD